MSKFARRVNLALAVCGLAMPAGAEGIATIRVVERATTDATAHIGPAPDNAGDLLTFANDIFDAKNESRIGTDQGYCIRIVPGKSYECQWTLFLADGQIAVAGPFLDAGDSTLAVTGGTGKYAGARGEMALHARDAKGSAYDFTYRLAVE
jgi:hypothetical protein